MKISDIEPIRVTPYLIGDNRAVAGTTYLSSSLKTRDDASRLDPMGAYPIVLPTQTHSSNVAWVREEDVKPLSLTSDISETCRLYPDTDALLTTLRGVAIGVRTADCLPILLYARDIQAVGVVHAGWRGTLSGIAGMAVAQLKAAGADPANIMVRFAPAICGLCYEVDNELAQRFAEAGLACAIERAPSIDPLTEEKWDELKPHIDLVKANSKILSDVGIPTINFYRSELCTRHTSLMLLDADGARTIYPYHSWRRESGTSERNTTFVLLLPSEMRD